MLPEFPKDNIITISSPFPFSGILLKSIENTGKIKEIKHAGNKVIIKPIEGLSSNETDILRAKIHKLYKIYGNSN